MIRSEPCDKFYKHVVRPHMLWCHINLNVRQDSTLGKLCTSINVFPLFYILES